MGIDTVAIIGAGIGGLAAGCAAQRAGIEARIFEMHSLPGGMCTAWTRAGFTFDGCIHHLAGCTPGGALYRMWEELGAMPRELLFPRELTQVEAPDGRTLTIHTDLDRLEAHLMESFPRDRRPLRTYLRAVRSLRRYDLLELPARGPTGLVRYLPVAPRLIRWGRVTMRQAADRFRDPFLRRAFPTLQYDWPDIPAVVHLNMLAQCAVNNYGFPAGGSLAFARSIARQFEELGGRIAYDRRVTTILTEQGRAVGVRLSDGTEHRADAVISDAFAHTTIFDLLGGQHVDDELRAQHAVPVDRITMGLHVSLGVDRDLSAEPHALVLLLDEPVQLVDRTLDRILVELYGFDPSLAPPGKGVIKVLLDASYRRWSRWAEDRAAYDAAKMEVADAVVAVLEPRFPGLSRQVEAMDVATPVTTERYTGNGLAYAPASGGPSVMSMMFGRPKRLPGLRRCYLVGQSAGGAGLPGCAAMGRRAIAALRRERQPHG